MEPFFAIVSTLLLQIGLAVFCFIRKTSKVRVIH